MRSASAKQAGLTEELIDDGIDNWRDSENFTEAEKLALEYSELMDSEPEKIDETFYARLREHYSDEEIVELGSFIGFNVGYHTFFRTLDFYPMFLPRRPAGEPGGIASHLRRLPRLAHERPA